MTNLSSRSLIFASKFGSPENPKWELIMLEQTGSEKMYGVKEYFAHLPQPGSIPHQDLE